MPYYRRDDIRPVPRLPQNLQPATANIPDEKPRVLKSPHKTRREQRPESWRVIANTVLEAVAKTKLSRGENIRITNVIFDKSNDSEIPPYVYLVKFRRG
jgi:hypothetical protein